MRGRRRIGRAVLAGALILAAVLAVGFAMNRWETGRYAATAAAPTASPTPEAAPRQLEWQGETYTARPDLESYLLIGVDEMGEAVGTESYIGGGQGDVQMLLVLDNANQTWQVLQLNRDSMVEMPVLGVNGGVIGTDTAQLALAHSYGNGREESCENNVTTVSRLLEDQPIGRLLCREHGRGQHSDRPRRRYNRHPEQRPDRLQPSLDRGGRCDPDR